jgi:uncharacterized protein YbjT (DUF2867 family)
MSDRKVIAVVGATGSQGGGLVRAIQADPDSGFVARAITRNPDSPSAKALNAAGAEVVQADIDDPATLVRAFDGAYGVYCVTFYWAHFSPEREALEAKTMAEVARQTGVQHAIWSTLEDTRRFIPLDDPRMPTLMDKYKVPHFDAKGQADQYFADSGVPTTCLLTSFYWDNFITFGMGPKKAPDGKLVLSLPMGEKKLPGIVAEDIGRCAFGIFKRGQQFMEKTVGIAGEHLSGKQMAAAFTRVLGREVVYSPVPFDDFRKRGFPGADDLGNMFQFKHDFNELFCAARGLEFSKSLNPQMQTLDRWLAAHKDSIAVE